MAERTEHTEPGQSGEDAEALFGGAGQMFMKLTEGIGAYAEYGCGTSTRWVAANTSASIVSVESHQEWAESVQSAIGDRGSVSHVAMGPIGKWGRPKTYRRRGQFATYQEWPWSRGGGKPELVLVDGRFRVACFLVSLLEARPGTPIVFDDYKPRPHYHLVEEFVDVAEWCGRQAMFRVPELSRGQRKQVQQVREAFRLVMD